VATDMPQASATAAGTLVAVGEIDETSLEPAIDSARRGAFRRDDVLLQDFAAAASSAPRPVARRRGRRHRLAVERRVEEPSRGSGYHPVTRPAGHEREFRRRGRRSPHADRHSAGRTSDPAAPP